MCGYCARIAYRQRGLPCLSRCRFTVTSHYTAETDIERDWQIIVETATAVLQSLVVSGQVSPEPPRRTPTLAAGTVPEAPGSVESVAAVGTSADEEKKTELIQRKRDRLRRRDFGLSLLLSNVPMSRGADVSTCRCLDVPMSRRANVSRCRCVDVPMSQRANVSTCRCLNVPMSHRADVSSCRCLDVPMSRGADVSTCRCLDVPMSRRADVSTCRCHNVPMSRRADVTTCQCLAVPMSQRADVPTCRCPNVPMSQRADVSTCRCLNVPMSQRADVSTCRCLNVPMSPKFINGSFAALFDHVDIVAEYARHIRCI